MSKFKPNINHLMIVGILIVAIFTIDASCRVDRLPKNIVPLSYTIDIEPNLENLDYRGKELIKIQVSKSDIKNCANELVKKYFCLDPLRNQNGNKITLHAEKSVEIHSVKYLNFGETSHSSKGTYVKVIKIDLDESKQEVTITLDGTLKPDSFGQLEIEFSGNLRKYIKTPIYSTYGTKPSVFYTQLGHAGLRKFMPCFDEPEFKASFELRIFGIDEESSYIATGDQLSTETDNPKAQKSSSKNFVSTEPISPHSFAFVIGKLEKMTKTTKSGVEVEVYTLPGRIERASFALETAVKGIEWMESYTNVKFMKQRFSLVAVEGRLSSETSNAWGLAVVSESNLLVDEESRSDTKVAVAMNVLYAVAQQWFGHYISPRWWTDHWIFSGLSALSALKMSRYIHFKLDSFYFVKYHSLSRLLDMEQTKQQIPLRPKNSDSISSVEDLFQEVSFLKSAAVIQTSERLMYEEEIQSDLRKILHMYKNNNIATEDFLDAFGPKPLKNRIVPWLKQSGFPVIKLDMKSNKKLVVSREPSFKGLEITDWENAKDDWVIDIPIYFCDGKQFDFERYTLDASQISITPPKWFKFSDPDHFVIYMENPNMLNYFKVEYSDNLLTKLVTFTNTDFLTSNNRMPILDSSLDKLRKIIHWFQHENNPDVLLQLLRISKTVDELGLTNKSFERDYEVAFSSMFNKKNFDIEPVSSIEEVAMEEIYSYLVKKGDKTIIEEALKVYSQKDFIVPHYWRPAVYMAVVQKGTEQQVYELISTFKMTQEVSEIERIGFALARSRNEKVLSELIAVIKDKDGSNFDKIDFTKNVIENMKSTPVGLIFVNHSGESNLLEMMLHHIK